MREKLAGAGQPQRPFDEMFEHAMTFLANPWKIWTSGHLEAQRTILKLAFADRLAYRRNQGFRTPEISMPFKYLGSFEGGKMGMARPGRLELPTS